MNFFKKIKKNNFLDLFKKENIVYFIIVTSIFFVDRISKIKIIEHQTSNNRTYINDFINFDLIWNTGIGFGLLTSNSNYVYNTITIIIGIILIFIIYLIIKGNFIDKLLLSTILGGGIGNFYDRIVYLAVPDFIDFHYQSFHWFTFNIADIFITIGIIMLLGKDLLKNDKN